MFCTNCGEENPDKAKFCWNCGAELHASLSSDRSSVNVERGGVASGGDMSISGSKVAGRDIIERLQVQAGVGSELELEYLLRDRLFLANTHKNRDDVERWRDLCRARGKRIELANAQLAGVSLKGVELIGANLYRADLSNANLREANLRKTNLRGANLSDADLGGADLRHADLYRADLSKAWLIGTSLYRAVMPDGSTYRGDKDLIEAFGVSSCTEYHLWSLKLMSEWLKEKFTPEEQ